MKNKALTLTVIANMTSNYSEGLGNISRVQTIYKHGKVYSMRSKESLKNALMVQSGLYNDLETTVDKATQKLVTKDINAATCAALESGYMSTKPTVYKRNSSFYLTDAVSCEPFINNSRFHNNLHLASNYAKNHNINMQSNKGASECGLMPYQYEFDKSLKIYSITIDLDMVGKDENFNAEATEEEKAIRIQKILTGIKNLSLVVKGSMDNAEPIFIIGGIVDRKTHYFENVINVKNNELVISNELKERVNNSNCYIGLIENKLLNNEDEIKNTFNNVSSISDVFNNLSEDINNFYNI